MFDVLMTLDLRQLLLAGHVMAMALGLAVALSVVVIVLRSLRSNRISADVIDTIEQAARFISISVAMLWISGIGFVVYSLLYTQETPISSMVYAKAAIMVFLTINGCMIYRICFPILRKYCGRHVLASATLYETLMLAICGAVSLVSWWFPVYMSINPNLSFAYESAAGILGQYFVTLGFMVLLACAVSLKQRERSRAASLLSYHGKAVAEFR